MAEAELFFVGGESDPALVLQQLALALQVWRPWALIFVSEETPEELDRLRALLLGVRDLIGEELSAIKLWRPRTGDNAGCFLEEKLWVMALERGAEAWRRELLFIDAMVPTPPGVLELEGVAGWHFTEGMWLGQTAVTQQLYWLVMEENPSFFNGGTRPVEEVSWEDGLRFMNRLSALAGLNPAYERANNDADFLSEARGFRLPFDVEWEWAARGGEEHEYAGSDNLDEVGWATNDNHGETHPVGQLRANGYGCYDLSGNVYEWCVDDSNPKQYRFGADKCVRRGGSYRHVASCRVSWGGEGYPPDFHGDDIGLRLSRSLD